jgi:hypothetical protein
MVLGLKGEIGHAMDAFDNAIFLQDGGEELNL